MRQFLASYRPRTSSLCHTVPNLQALGACHRQAGRTEQAIAQFTELYELILDTQGPNTVRAMRGRCHATAAVLA